MAEAITGRVVPSRKVCMTEKIKTENDQPTDAPNLVRGNSKKYVDPRAKQQIGIERIYGQDLRSVLLSLQSTGMSTTQMQEELEKKLGFPFSNGLLCKWIKMFGLSRGRSFAGKLRWKMGLMDAGAKKSKAALVRARIVGSKLEERIRWELNLEMANWNDFDAVIGFTNWSILRRWEVDIPIVLISRSDQKITKIAIEIDGELWHKKTERWELKRDELAKAGWHALNVVLATDELREKAYQVFTRKDVRSLKSVEKLFGDIRAILGMPPEIRDRPPIIRGKSNKTAARPRISDVPESTRQEHQ